jgi:hypothetical protein
MAEAQNYTFSFQEIAEALIKKQKIHQGLWGIYVEFGLSAANLGKEPGTKDVVPAAIIPIVKIGIQKFKEENNLTVNASKVNPGKPKKGK